MPLQLVSCVALVLLAAVPAWSQWKLEDRVDGWGDVVGQSVASPWVAPNRLLDAPYEDLQARVLIHRCNSVKVEFNMGVNLVGEENIRSAPGTVGFSDYDVAFRFSPQAKKQLPFILAGHEWGSRVLHLKSTLKRGLAQSLLGAQQDQLVGHNAKLPKLVNLLKANDSVSMLFQWYGAPVSFTWDLGGAEKTISHAMKGCKGSR